jgi:hypothetical protein
VRDREQQQRHLGRSKWPAFGWALLTACGVFPSSVRLKINGEEHLRRTPFVFIGNNEYLQGLTLGARERLDTGKLCLYVAQKPTRLGLLRYAVHALFGRLQEARDFDVLSAPSLDIETRHQRLRVATDGEVTLMSPPLCYRSRAAALNVIVPPPLRREHAHHRPFIRSALWPGRSGFAAALAAAGDAAGAGRGGGLRRPDPARQDRGIQGRARLARYLAGAADRGAGQSRHPAVQRRQPLPDAAAQVHALRHAGPGAGIWTRKLPSSASTPRAR